MRLPHMGAKVHTGGVVPAEERRIRPDLPLHEFDGGCGRLIVDCLHALAGERAGVFDGLLADLAPTRLLGRVVAVRRLGAQYTARAKGLPKRWVAWVGA